MKLLKRGNSRIMEYQIVWEDNKPGLEAEVNELISCGWRPLGGLALVAGEEWDAFGQAMTRENKEDLKKWWKK